MARYMQKRKRSTGRNYASKKRKTNFKRKGRAIGQNYTSNAQKGTVLGFRGKKTSRRAYKKHLWDSSTFTTHYRSGNAITSTHATLASVVDGPVNGFNMLRYGVPFWTTGGGAITPDTGIAMPPLAGGNVVLRGGVWTMSISNTGDHDITVRMFQGWTVDKPTFSPYEPSTNGRGWEPSTSPDFTRFVAKIYKTSESIVQPGESWTFGGRLKLQKIDVAQYTLEGRCPIIYLHVYNTGVPIAVGYRVTSTYNLSFTMDAG